MRWFPESQVPRHGWTPISRPCYVFSGWGFLLFHVIAIGLIVYGYLIAKTMDDRLVNSMLLFGAPFVLHLVLGPFRRDPRPYPPAEQQETTKPAQDNCAP